MSPSDCNNYFRSVFEKAGVGLAIVNMPIGIVQEANSIFCELLGYAMPEMVGKRLSTLFSPADVIVFEAAVGSTIQTGIQNCISELQYHHKNGSQIWCRTTISVLRRELGICSSCVVVIEDIGEAKKHESELIESLLFYKRISDSARDFIFDKAVPIALILNELIANSYCHAFVGREEGDIWVGFSRHPETACYILEIGDNGVGFPDGFDNRNATSLGYINL